MSSARSHEAAQQLAATERQAPGPYLFLGYSDLGAQRVISRADPLAAPKQTTLLDVYREFRRVKPSGRFSIWTGFSIDDATGRPREFVALDSQLVEKAHVLPIGGLASPPLQSDAN
jgi:hypothetical protein